MTRLRIESLAIGDELLDGRVLDSNTRELGDALSVLGLELSGARTIPDDRALIVRSLHEAVARADIVVTSGGLGPTSDDVTAECVAEAAGVQMRFCEPSFARMEAMFSMRGIPMPPSNRRQAMLPSSSRTLENQQGTAPGFVTPFVVDGRNVEVWSFPGVPREYRHLRDDHLLPAVRTRLDGGTPRTLLRRTLRSLGLAESAIGERLRELERDNTDVRVQYRAAFPEIVVRLVLDVDAGDADAVQHAQQRLDELAARARAAIGHSVWNDDDSSLESVVSSLLRARRETLASAESCTGGIIGKRITDLAGSSEVFVGGVVAYANAAKTALVDVDAATIATHGAVSADVAGAMAQGARARLHASWGLSTTGVAGPGGGSVDKPVGTVWFGIARPDGTTTTMHKKLPDFGRDRVREMAAATALRWLVDELRAHARTEGTR